MSELDWFYQSTDDTSPVHTTYLSERDWERFMEKLDEDPTLSKEMKSAIETHNQLITDDA